MFSPVQSTDRSAVVVCLTDQIGKFFQNNEEQNSTLQQYCLDKIQKVGRIRKRWKKIQVKDLHIKLIMIVFL